MKYVNPTFSLPVSDGKLSDEEYAIRVGLWKPQAEHMYAGLLALPSVRA